MPVLKSQFKPVTSMGNSTYWMYKTTDTLATVEGSNYFASMGSHLKIGDRILVTVVTNLGTSSEAYADDGYYIVTAASSSSVTIAVATGGSSTVYYGVSTNFSGSTGAFSRRGATLTGISGAHTHFTLAVVFRHTSLAAVQRLFGNNTMALLAINTSGFVQSSWTNHVANVADGSASLIPSNAITLNAWHCVLVRGSWNGVNPEAYIVSDWGANSSDTGWLSATPPSGGTSLGWDSTAITNWAIASTPAGGTYFRGDIQSVYFHMGTSYAATNYTDFFDGTSAIDLGADGTLTGLPAPLVYVRKTATATEWNANPNGGTGGAFSRGGAVSFVNVTS